jgi:glycosyltransferase involved in cell wall biosynthesis
MIVENLPVPFDRRVWAEAQSLRRAGYEVSVICPRGPFAESPFESIDSIEIHRHPLPIQARGKAAYIAEYSSALFWEFAYSLKVFWGRGFDAIHACNPPDTIFLIGWFYKIFGRKFVFDHHDINPELYEAKFGKRGFGQKLLLALERMTFRTADMVISTNESYRHIALTRGGVNPHDVFVVRSGPDLRRMKQAPPNPALKSGRRYLVGYVGVMGKQEGIDLLLQAVQLIVLHLKRTDIHFGLVGGGRATGHATARQGPRRAGVRDVHRQGAGCRTARDAQHRRYHVNPDRANEMNRSTMNKIMEYMALGKPVVQFDLTEGRVSAGEASWYARPNDVADLAQKIVALLADEPLRRRMSAIGRERIEHVLSWQHEAPRLLNAYEHLNKSAGERK